MKRNLLTDMELRAHWNRTREKTYAVAEDTMLTPAARDFIREHGIELVFGAGQASCGKMTAVPIPKRGTKARYIDAASRKELTEKPEEMTHLRGNLLVAKTHPQIALRGRLDSLMAEILSVQLLAKEEGLERMVGELEELLAYTRKILAAEVKDEPLEEPRLLGLDGDGVRRVSQHVKAEIGIDHPIPHYRMGRMCVALNGLRTKIRETELSAAAAFAEPEGRCSRRDIVKGLNRLSSCVYILFCRKLAGYYDGESGK